MTTKTNTPARHTERRLIEGEDFYWEGEFMVLTARHLMKRGYCCGSGCRHCPYEESTSQKSEGRKSAASDLRPLNS